MRWARGRGGCVKERRFEKQVIWYSTTKYPRAPRFQTPALLRPLPELQSVQPPSRSPGILNHSDFRRNSAQQGSECSKNVHYHIAVAEGEESVKWGEGEM